MVINTINAHSYVITKEDPMFKTALEESDILLPDGIGVTIANKLINKTSIKKIAGADIHRHLLNTANESSLKVFYLGASESTLATIESKINQEFPSITVETFSPPFKPVFSEEDNLAMISAINAFEPDILFVGMTAPKQEKWVHQNKKSLNTKVVVSIGAVFDFYAGTTKRAPKIMINLGLEWLHRAFQNKRLMKRYIYSSPKFISLILRLYLKR